MESGLEVNIPTRPFPPGVRLRLVSVPVVISPAPTKSRLFISSTVPSTDRYPASALSSIVTLPVEASTLNSSKLIAVAPPLIAVRLVPLRVVVFVRLTVSALVVSMLPAAPLPGDRRMFPVLSPPIVSVLFSKL